MENLVTKEKQETRIERILTREDYAQILKELQKNQLFRGTYDAAHGDENFMYGISVVIEAVAEKAGCAGDTNSEFAENMLKSKGRARGYEDHDAQFFFG